MKPYKQKPGEFEIRILPDGKVLVPAPDSDLLELAGFLNQPGDRKCRVKKESNKWASKSQQGKTKKPRKSQRKK